MELFQVLEAGQRIEMQELKLLLLTMTPMMMD
jgi:hypothetical protein